MQEAPDEGYPRLVRESPEETYSYLWHFENVDIISDIASNISKDRLSVGKLALKKAVFKLAQKYGPPTRHEDHTLDAWKRLAIKVHTELWIWREFNANAYHLARFAIISRAHSLAVELGKDNGILSARQINRIFESSANLRVSEEAIFLAFNFRLDPNDARNIELNTLIIFWEWLSRIENRVSHPKSDGFSVSKNSIAEAKLDQFGIGLERNQDEGGISRIGFGSSGVSLTCPIGVWLDYKLSEMWRNSQCASVCPVCGTLFLRSRTNTIYCKRGTCADKQYRTNRIASTRIQN